MSTGSHLRPSDKLTSLPIREWISCRVYCILAASTTVASPLLLAAEGREQGENVSASSERFRRRKEEVS